ncbi:BatD family protein [Prevotella sp.]|uniref:BatD family protein n=1 Tax=Prevotella sp. TaxID=59823 RepID=UPI0025F00F8D|nr:BatD family protein [Prevotella sp.]
MKKAYILLLFVMVCVLTVNAQVISVSAPSKVSAGENFRLSFTINTDDVDDFRAGSIPSGLEVIAGPYTSQQSSYQIVNGHTSRSSSITFTYTLYADKPGTYTVSGAKARVGGKTIASHHVIIKVGAGSRHGNGAPQMHEDAEPRMSSSGKISANDLFVKVSASKRRVCEQEPVLLTYKVYTLVDLTSLDGKMPDLKGFHTQEVPLPQQKSFHLEKVNGKNYRCVTWSQYVMFPQMTGKLSIPSITFKGIVVQRNNSVDPFEAFFNGGSGYVEVKRNIVAPGIDIQVDPLPKRQVDFSGGVGHFTISAQLNHKTVKEGEPLTLRVVVGGIGNLKLIKQPVVDFPKDFDRYDPKVSDKTKLTANGIEGNMIYDYLVVPRNRGDYTIPAVSLTYYDTSTNSYKTIKTQPLQVKIEKGDGNKTTVDDFSDQPKDIKPIKTSDEDVVGVYTSFVGSGSYWLWLVLPFVVFVAVLVVFRKRALDSANIVASKQKRATKVATKRLKTAYRLMKAGRSGEFYDEVLRALWGYVGDRMNMPVESLSRENVVEAFEARNVQKETTEKFVHALDECEFERYSPGDPAGNMNKTYESAMIAIMDIENTIKTAKKKVAAPVLLALITLLFAATTATAAPAKVAITKVDADKEYAKGNYLQASKDYSDLLKVGESVELYYNSGNCYYRLGNITKSIIAYEKAHRLSPSDRDVTFNLEFVREKTIDKIERQEKNFFSAGYTMLQNLMDMDAWARLSIVAFFACLGMAMLFLLGRDEWMRKLGFYVALLSVFVFVFSTLFAWQQKHNFDARDRAVVVAPSANVKLTPSDSSADAVVVHEGTAVQIVDRTMSDWYSVKLDDGKEGWLKRNSLEII